MMAMDKYYTKVEIPQQSWKFNFQSKLLLLGSCFADSIGARLEALKFSAVVNPFGTLYNPSSVGSALRRIMTSKQQDESALFLQQGLYKNFQFHSQFNRADAEEALLVMNEATRRAHEQLKLADLLFITFGSAWVYERLSTSEVVANCHKCTSSEFKRRRLSVENIVELWLEVLAELQQFNPRLKIIFSLSPIRHWKDGAHGNQLSKATLLLAIEEIIAQARLPCSYFPAYELVMDELRDYRFYAEDLLHLSEPAVSHIWEQVKGSMIEPNCTESMRKIGRLNAAMKHRIFHGASEEVARFAAANQRLIEELEQECPMLNFSAEKMHFKHTINKKLVEQNA